jgi:hypothetical protein
MRIRHKTGERLDEHRLYPSFKPRTHTFYILRHYTSIVHIDFFIV